MKTPDILKLIFLLLPCIIMAYVFFLRDRLDTGDAVGGGSYDLTRMFAVIGIGGYLLVYNLVLLLQSPEENKFFLFAGAALLVFTIIKAANVFS